MAKAGFDGYTIRTRGRMPFTYGGKPAPGKFLDVTDPLGNTYGVLLTDSVKPGKYAFGGRSHYPKKIKKVDEKLKDAGRIRSWYLRRKKKRLEREEREHHSVLPVYVLPGKYWEEPERKLPFETTKIFEKPYAGILATGAVAAPVTYAAVTGSTAAIVPGVIIGGLMAVGLGLLGPLAYLGVSAYRKAKRLKAYRKGEVDTLSWKQEQLRKNGRDIVKDLEALVYGKPGYAPAVEETQAAAAAEA